jgi:hypothetical protein
MTYVGLEKVEGLLPVSQTAAGKPVAQSSPIGRYSLHATVVCAALASASVFVIREGGGTSAGAGRFVRSSVARTPPKVTEAQARAAVNARTHLAVVAEEQDDGGFDPDYGF